MSGSVAQAGAGGAPAWDARLGLVTALAVVLAVLVALRLGLPDPWWAAITAWRVVDLRPAAALMRGLQRVLGTVAGAVFGYIVAGLFLDSTVLQLVVLFGATVLGTWQRFTSVRWNYAWTLGVITAMLVMVQGLGTPQGLYDFALFRVLEILCGVAVATVVEVLLVRPGRAPPALAQAVPVGPEAMRVALLTGLALVIAVLLWHRFDTPAIVPTAISIAVVVDRDVIRLRARGMQRILGCFAGGAYALALIGIGLDGVLAWAVAIGGGVFLFSMLSLGTGPYAYFGIQGGMALLTALIVGTGPPDRLEPVLDRLAGILIGVTLVVALSYVLAPRREPLNPG